MKEIVLIAASTMIVACAVQAAGGSGPEQEKSFDGLSRVDSAEFTKAWIEPDIDFTRYTKIIPGNADFEFRAVKESPDKAKPSPRETYEREYWISDENKQKLIDEVTAIFAEELANSKHFTIVDEVGRDTLIIVGGLHDIVSRVPPDAYGSGEIYLASLGEATLILEARDSLSGETIYRAVDRQRIEKTGRHIMKSNAVRNWSEVRSWAVRLREGLDAIHQ